MTPNIIKTSSRLFIVSSFEAVSLAEMMPALLVKQFLLLPFYPHCKEDMPAAQFVALPQKSEWSKDREILDR